MQIVNYVRAHLFHSSEAAYNLAKKNKKHYAFAKQIISIKTSEARWELIRLDYNRGIRAALLKLRLDKYSNFLTNLDFIYPEWPEKKEELPRIGSWLEYYEKMPIYDHLIPRVKLSFHTTPDKTSSKNEPPIIQKKSNANSSVVEELSPGGTRKKCIHIYFTDDHFN
ncbi:hypothetical protein ACQYRI_10515 [Salmonella enterica]